ncbi:MAG: FKBP-type peptidyl-prolyl cis-trans isomerase [Candidatus Zixiibacteriota bacterium]
MTKTIALAFSLALVTAVGCKSESGEAEKDTATAQPKTETAMEKVQPVEPEILSKTSGVRYQDLVVGTGAEAALGTRVECHYTLWFSDSTGLQKVQRFQSSKDANRSFTCTLGQNLIQGWSDGMVGMKEGGTRRLYIPWALGYGEAGGGPIPAKTNLIFEIDFIKAVK